MCIAGQRPCLVYSKLKVTNTNSRTGRAWKTPRCGGSSARRPAGRGFLVARERPDFHSVRQMTEFGQGRRVSVDEKTFWAGVEPWEAAFRKVEEEYRHLQTVMSEFEAMARLYGFSRPTTHPSAPPIGPPLQIIPP